MVKEQKIDFSAKQQKLEEILVELRSGDLSIDKSIEKYHSAQKIISELEDYLTKSENQIKQVIDKTTKV